LSLHRDTTAERLSISLRKTGKRLHAICKPGLDQYRGRSPRQGLVSRVESAEDRRVRTVALTPRGKELIVSAFRKHSGQMKRVFSKLSPEELRGLEVKLKKVGKRAAALMEES